MTPRLTGTLAGTVALGVVLNVLEQPPQGFLLLGGQLSEHRDQHCTVAACPMQQGDKVSLYHAASSAQVGRLKQARASARTRHSR